MRLALKQQFLVVALALGGAWGCGVHGPEVDDGPPSGMQSDAGTPDAGTPDAGTPPETLDQLQARWASENASKPHGVAASFDVSGSPLELRMSGKTRLEAPATLVPGAIFPNNLRYVFLADAQVGSQKGLLLLEGTGIELSAGTMGDVVPSAVTARTNREDGGTAPAVVLALQSDSSGASKPSVTFPDDWSGAKDALFFSTAVAVQPSNVTLSGFTRGVLVTDTGSTPVSGSVTVASASRMYWDDSSRIETQTRTVDCTRFALGGPTDGGTLTSAEFTTPPPVPEAVIGSGARVTLRPGGAKSEGDFRLTQAATAQGLLLPAQVEVAYGTQPFSVKKDARVLVPVVYREKTLKGDAVLADLQITGSGKDAVRVAVDEPESVVGQLWDAVGKLGPLEGTILAVPLAIVTPFIALGEWLSCLFSTCPKPYPTWMQAGTAARFHIIVEGSLPPGTYEANVTVTGRNYAPFTVPVQFTVTE
jgi:hypothetical protein